MYVLIDSNGCTVPYNEFVNESPEVELTYENQIVKHVVDSPFNHWKTGCVVYHVMKVNDISWRITHKLSQDELLSFGIIETGTHDLADTLISRPNICNGVVHVKVGAGACVIGGWCRITAYGNALVLVNRPSVYNSVELHDNAKLSYTNGFCNVVAYGNSRITAYHQGTDSNLNAVLYDQSNLCGHGASVVCNDKSSCMLDYVVGQNSHATLNDTSSGKFMNVQSIRAKDLALVTLYGTSICSARDHVEVICHDDSIGVVADSVTVTLRDSSSCIGRNHTGPVTVLDEARYVTCDKVPVGQTKYVRTVPKVVESTTEEVLVKNQLPPLQKRPYTRKPKTPPTT